MKTVTDLRARLASLHIERDAIYRELLSSARAGEDRRVRWRDEDVATWLGTETVDVVRTGIVDHLTGFWVDEDCAAALLTAAEIARLIDAEGFDPPRKFDLDYLAGEIALTARYLAEVEGRGAARSS